MRGTFKSNEELKQFITPLKSVSSLMGDSGLVINFGAKANGQIPVTVSALNQSVGIVIHMVYKDIFDSFAFKDQNGCKIGVIKIGEFVNLFELFVDGEVEFDFDEDVKSLTLSQHKSKVIYKTADTDLIKQFTKTFSGTKWFATVPINESFQKFNKAMNVLSAEECIHITGDQESGKVSFCVRNKAMSVNSYSIDIDSQVTESFSSMFNKKILQKILDTNCQTMKISIGERICTVECENEKSTINYYVAKMI